MSSFRIVRYESSLEKLWNDFLKRSRNATFLFDRGYMDYHSDRFEDCSWLAFKGERLMAMLPANITAEGILQSHGGLTYGGWILPDAHVDGNDVLEIFEEACKVWKKCGIKALDYKTMPYFYCSRPSDEDQYALFRLGAVLTASAISATIDLRNPGKFNQLQRRHLAKASALPLDIRQTEDIDGFMRMLASCLKERHDTLPVHTSEEMKLLSSRFPQNIKFYVALLEGSVEAGVCIYDTGRVAHAQYIATTPKGRELNLLSPLVSHLVKEVYASADYFDFGISTEDNGRILNSGLLRQKYSFGATGTVYNRYLLNL